MTARERTAASESKGQMITIPRAPCRAAKVLVGILGERKAERLAAELLSELGFEDVQGWNICIRALRDGDYW